MEKQTLYVANTTKQHHIFCYQHPEQGLRRREIKAGSQIGIENLTTDQMALIIKGYEIYGIVDADKMSRTRGFNGFCYRIGQPVQMETMLSNYEQNDKALAAQSKERLKEEAAGIDESMARTLGQQHGVDPEQMRPDHLELQVIEATEGGAPPVIAAGVEVNKNPNAKPRRAAQ